MAFDGTGTFVRVHDWTDDADAAIQIRADRMDEEHDGFATGLSNCITKDGQTPVTANIPLTKMTLSGDGTTTSLTVTGPSTVGSNIAILTAASANPRYVRLSNTSSGQIFLQFQQNGVDVGTVGGGTTEMGISSGTNIPLSLYSKNMYFGPNGATNPALEIDADAASVATGLKIAGAAAASGVALAAISSGANENLTIDAKGSGTLTLAGTSTGAVLIPRAVAINGAAPFDHLLSVTGGAAQGAIISTAAAANDVISVWNKDTTGGNRFVSFSTEGTITERGTITYNRGGGLVAYNTTSDYRAKNLFGLFVDSGAVIDAIPVHLGRMKGADLDKPMFVAHEVADGGAAWAVTGEKDAEKFQQLSEGALVPILWAEVRSLRARLSAAGVP